MKIANYISLSFLSIVFAAGVSASDYLIAPGKIALGQSISHTSFDEFWAGSAKQPGVPGGGEIERTSYRSYIFYGIQEDLALDFSFGYADTSSVLSTDGSLTDYALGLSWQLAHEEDSSLDWMVRAGISIADSYEVGVLSAPGDGENSFDLMTKFGRSFTENGIRGDVEVGYTLSDGGDVPDSYRLKAGSSIPLGGGFAFDVSGIYFSGIDGIDIGGPGFSGLADLPKVEESGTAGEIGLSVATNYGYYRISVSQILDGRNIGEELTSGIFASFSF
ncbi:hypothetical protein MLD52_11310 [Puniceicoccaceae bacterium K14]|nr:hypothetical protein [Puniceicoccaceae bacterium K14]